MSNMATLTRHSHGERYRVTTIAESNDEGVHSIVVGGDGGGSVGLSIDAYEKGVPVNYHLHLEPCDCLRVYKFLKERIEKGILKLEE